MKGIFIIMATLNIIKEGDPILRKISKPVKEITPRILRLLDDMKETLIAAEGAGLACRSGRSIAPV